MEALSAALQATLCGDQELVGLLGTWNGGPSVFRSRPVPQGAGRPAVIAADTVSDEPADLIGKSVGRNVVLNVGVYGNSTDADESLRVARAADRLRELLHHNRFLVEGWCNLMTLASGPVDAPADPQDEAKMVTLRVRLQRFA